VVFMGLLPGSKWVAGIAAAFVAAGGALYSVQPNPETAAHIVTPNPVVPLSEPAPLRSPAALDEIPAKKTVTVAIAGAVRRPSLYEMPEGSRVQNLIDRAGGPTEAAELEDINIAALLVDGTTLTLPGCRVVGQMNGQPITQSAVNAAELNPPCYLRGGAALRPAPAVTAQAPAATQPTPAGLVNLNTATPQDLEALPQIGPVTAQRIIAYRSESPFQSVEELINVAGIGEVKMDRLRDLVSVGP
jgi:competence protein ComEA